MLSARGVQRGLPCHQGLGDPTWHLKEDERERDELGIQAERTTFSEAQQPQRPLSQAGENQLSLRESAQIPGWKGNILQAAAGGPEGDEHELGKRQKQLW